MSAFDELLEQLADPSQLAWNQETYDLVLANTLSGDERAKYVARLVETAQRGDTHAILTLGYLQAAEALEMLRAGATSDVPWAPTARRALVLLGYGDEVVDAVAKDALHTPAKMARVAAVLALSNIGGAKAIAALAEALGDPDAVVRMLAWNGLVAALELEPWLRSPRGAREKGSRLELLKDLLASDVAALASIGIDEMRAVVEQLVAGADPAALDIAYAPDPAPDVTTAITEAVAYPDAAYPLDEIAKLAGLARRRAEASLALSAEVMDPRVPDALVYLGATWTAPALAEIAGWPSAPPEHRARLSEAARMLAARGVLRGVTSLEQLLHALADTNLYVRLLAWEKLVEALGLTRRIRNPDGNFEGTTEIEVMSVLLASELPPLARLGADGMRQTVRRLAAGATAQQLGIAWRPNPAPEVFARLRGALLDREAAIPTGGVAQLTGAPRLFAEAMIALRLEDRDARVPAALIELDAAWLAPALDELATSPDLPAELRAALAHAVGELRAS